MMDRGEATLNTPLVHDWKQRGRGSDYIFRPVAGGMRGTITGWRLGLRRGDVLVLYHGSCRAAYIIDSIEYYSDPRDMFEASVHYEQGLLIDEVDATLTVASTQLKMVAIE